VKFVWNAQAEADGHFFRAPLRANSIQG